jgi:glycosyltransferase involved in cell wall biosynthesis
VALAAAGDNAALSGAVESLLSDEGERRRMAQAARTFYQERFDLHRALAAVRQPAN